MSADGVNTDNPEASVTDTVTGKARRTARFVVILNLAYFGVEFAVALSIGSVSLFADSVDFLEDATINLLILLALGWSARQRSCIGMLLSGIILIPGLATLWTVWRKFIQPVPPSPLSLSLTGSGAFAVNLLCAILLAQCRQYSGSLTHAAFLSARNDVLASIAIIAAGLATAFTRSPWPDVIVGLGIALMNVGAAHEVYKLAREEHRATTP